MVQLEHTPLKLASNNLSTLLLVAFLVGCASSPRGEVRLHSHAPKSALEVFYLDEAPLKKHTEIAALSFRGPGADQSKAFRYFIKEAKRVGADGVVIYVPGYDYLKAGRLGLEQDILFKASAFVYNP